MTTITLSAEAAISAASVATLQILRKIAKQRNGDHGGRSDRGMRERWADGIHGSMAEVALSQALNLAWTPGGMRISRGDVGNMLEVRATEHLGGHLIVYEDDADESLFVLMIGHFPSFRIAGCMLGKSAKQQQWWRQDKDPASYWVPQSALEPLGVA
jgi:hypothetical protein